MSPGDAIVSPESAKMECMVPDVPYYIFDIDGTLSRYVDFDSSSFLHGNFLFPIIRDMMVDKRLLGLLRLRQRLRPFRARGLPALPRLARAPYRALG